MTTPSDTPIQWDADRIALQKRLTDAAQSESESRRQRIVQLYEMLTAKDAELAAAQEWREAVLNELIVAHIYTKEHDTNPRKAIQDAITWNCQVALDPAVSSDARKLIADAHDKAIKYDLDQAGIEKRHSESVELVELRAKLAAAQERIRTAEANAAAFGAELRKMEETGAPRGWSDVVMAATNRAISAESALAQERGARERDSKDAYLRGIKLP